MSIIDFFVLIAVIPSILLMLMVYKKDKIEKEPLELLIKIFGFGVLSAILTMIVGSIVELIALLFLEEGSALYVFINAFFMVALVEEGSKFVMLKTSSWKEKEFNYTYDAVIYAVFASLGFATIENILYVFSYGVAVAILRALSAVPAHMIFGVFMGIYYGKAKVCENLGDNKGKKFNLAMSIITPMLLHGLYDYCLMTELVIAKVVFFAILIFLYVYMFAGINKLSREDKKIEKEENVKIEM